MRRMDEPRSFPQFWTFYVLAHCQPLTRHLHTVGTLAGWLLLVMAIVLRRPWYVLAALIVPYAFAWFSHFFVEHNRPATLDIRYGPGWRIRKWSRWSLAGK